MIARRKSAFPVAAALCVATAFARADSPKSPLNSPAPPPVNPSALSAPGGYCDIQNKLYSLFEKNKASIVKVYAQKQTESKDENGNPQTQDTLDVGSGILAGKGGVVLTSACVTCTAKKIWIEWNGLLFDADSVGLDPLTTLAVVKVRKSSKLKDAPNVVSDSSRDLAPIATLIALISYEMGLPPAPRLGLATGHNIEFGGNFLPTVYLRTNIPLVRGGIGGGVFDIDGKFVGMVIAALPEIGGSFILPAAAAAKIRDDILLCGEPVYSWFGLRAEDAEGDGRTKIVVTMVAENAPAKKAGFMVGDEILEINSHNVVNNNELRRHTFFVRPGEIATFKIKRGTEILKLEVLAEKMDSEILKTAEKKLASSLQKRTLPNLGESAEKINPPSGAK